MPNYIEGETKYLQSKGRDTNGVADIFQFHEHILKKQEISLSFQD